MSLQRTANRIYDDEIITKDSKKCNQLATMTSSLTVSPTLKMYILLGTANVFPL